MKVFLSYHSNDRSVATRLAKALEGAGLEVFDSQRDADARDNSFAWTAKALEDSQAMVFVVSPDAVESKWTMEELGYALTQPRFQGRLVPVLAKPTKHIPWILRKLETVDIESGVPQAAKKASELIKRSLSERRRIFGS